MDATTSKPSARCLDLTRLVSRVGRGPWTGIDRVENAYLNNLILSDIPLFALVRLTAGFAILEPAGVLQLRDRLLAKTNWGQADVQSWLSRGSNPLHRRAVSDVRRLATGRISKRNLAGHLTTTLPGGTSYINVGHSNISPAVFTAFRAMANAKIVVFLHDTIPLDFPQFQRPETVPAFEDKIRCVREFADLVICNSTQTKNDVTRHMAGLGNVPNMLVAHLGVVNAPAAFAELPDDITTIRPYFVTTGTIEPRKNHRLLLDLWQRFAGDPTAPHLFVVGQRGWENKVIFDRLDKHPANVTELGNLTDGAVTALLRGARGLLFPSHGEGFGLPAAEAAKLGVPVLCSKLSVFREILGEYPIYADVADLYEWETKVRKLANNSEDVNNGRSRPEQDLSLPTWDTHFNLVLSSI